MSQKRTSNKQSLLEGIEWLKALLALATIILLLVIYFFLPSQSVQSGENRLLSLVESLIPEFVSVLLAVSIVYLVFYRKGLTSEQLSQNIDTDSLAQAITQKIQRQGTQQHDFPIIAFHEVYRSVNWPQLILSGQHNIDIVVYYLDSWVAANYDPLVSYFRKPRSKIRLFVSDPNDDFTMKVVHKLFPEYNEEVLKSKIIRTGKLLAQALSEAGGSADRLEVYYVPGLLNYSARCIDYKELSIGLFEINRQLKIDSPIITIDLSKSVHLTEFWDKEIQGLLNISKKVKDKKDK